MIINALLGVVQLFVKVLFAPLTPINFAINGILGITYVADFLKIVIWILPWNNIVPLLEIVGGIFAFRAIVALIKTIWDLLPIL